MSRPNVGKSLYYKLPNLYREEDANVEGQLPLPLKRFLDVFASGFDYMEDKIEGLENLYDLDKCPAEFLPYIAQTLGFDFPYALSENEQRRFIKVLPYLYMTKGEPKSFEYLAREIFGTQSTIQAYKETYVEGMTVQQWRRIYVEVTTDGEQLNLGRKEVYFRKFAELVRPVNTLLIAVLTTYLSDDYERERLGDDYDVEFILENNAEIYRTRSILAKLLDKNIMLDGQYEYREEDIVDTIKEEWVQNLIIECYEDKIEKHNLLDAGFMLDQSMTDSLNSGCFIDTVILDAISDVCDDKYAVFIREFEEDLLTDTSEDVYRTKGIVASLLYRDLVLDQSTTDFIDLDTIKEEWIQNLVMDSCEDVFNRLNSVDDLIHDALTELSEEQYAGLKAETDESSITENSEDTYEKQIAEDFSTLVTFTGTRSALDSKTLLDGFYLDDIQVSMTPSY